MKRDDQKFLDIHASRTWLVWFGWLGRAAAAGQGQGRAANAALICIGLQQSQNQEDVSKKRLQKSSRHPYKGFWIPPILPGFVPGRCLSHDDARREPGGTFE